MPSPVPTIEANVTLLNTAQGGRRTSIFIEKESRYRPHLVVGDPSQREAIVRDGAGVEPYLGVEFVGGPPVVHPGDACAAELSLMYYPEVDYSALIPGATFTIREGGKVVGFGQVVSRRGS